MLLKTFRDALKQGRLWGFSQHVIRENARLACAHPHVCLDGARLLRHLLSCSTVCRDRLGLPFQSSLSKACQKACFSDCHHQQGTQCRQKNESALH